VASGEGPARLSALSVLVFGGPKTLGELAAAEQVKPPTMSRIVAVLARSKLVTIHAETQDARRMHIRATAKGVKLLQEGRQRRIDYSASRLSGLTREELAQVAESTEILARVL
jgi:DNA-binding MarR family transcriptional regulator